MAMVQGREISRKSASEHVIGHGLMQNILLISQFAPEATRSDAIDAEVLGRADTVLDFVETAPLGLKGAVRQLMADRR